MKQGNIDSFALCFDDYMSTTWTHQKNVAIKSFFMDISYNRVNAMGVSIKKQIEKFFI